MQFVGIPSVITGSTAASATTLAGAIVNPEPLTANAGDLIRRSLDGIEGNLFVLIDTKNRRVYATDSASHVSAIKTAIANPANGTFAAHKLTPDAGQDGRSLTWTVGVESGTPNAGKAALLGNLVNAAKPTRTVESLVNAIYSSVVADTDAQPALVAVDQAAKKVIVYEHSNAATIGTAIAAIAPPANTKTFAMLLTPESSTGTTPDKPFEGGLV